MVDVTSFRISAAVLALIAGILILIFPKALRMFIGFYLLLAGIVGILENMIG